MNGRAHNKKQLVFRHKTVAVIIGLLVFLVSASRAHAASLFLNPSQGSYATGSVIPVDVIVDTEGDTINAVSGTLQFDAATMRPSSVRISDSVVTLWITQPGVSTKGNSVTFEGLILNPGFTGKGKVATIYFEVTGAGAPKVNFASGMTLKNDGLGTNILEHLAGATFTISGSGGAPITKGSTSPLPQGNPSDPSAVVLGALRPPVITGYTMHPKTADEFAVQGVTYPNAKIKLWMQDTSQEPRQFDFTSDAAGNFSYRIGTKTVTEPLLQASALSAISNSLQGAPYRFWLAATVDGVETPTTQPFEFVVGGFGIPELLLVIVILLILGVVGLLIFEMILLRRVYDHDHVYKGEQRSVIAPAHYPQKQ